MVRVSNATIRFIIRFSGAEPEHICESDLDILEQHDYFMSKKGSGLRTMLFIFTTSDGPAAFLVWLFIIECILYLEQWTSRNALWYNPMMFPLPNNPNFAHTDTLIDGELNFTKTNSDQPVSRKSFNVSFLISHLLLIPLLIWLLLEVSVLHNDLYQLDWGYLFIFEGKN